MVEFDDGRRKLLKTTAAAGFAALLGNRNSAAEETTLQPEESAPQPAGIGKLYAIGGAMTRPRRGEPLPEKFNEHDVHNIMQRLCKDSDAGNRQIVIVTNAADNEIDDGAVRKRYTREYFEEFKAAGASKIILISSVDDVLHNKAALNAINDPKTSMIFFGGGDQERLVAEFRYGLPMSEYPFFPEGGSMPTDTPIYKALVERARKKDIMVMGTSAGASALSKHMVQEHRLCLPGFEIAADYVIDTHANRQQYKYKDGQPPEPIPLRKADRVTKALHHHNNTSRYGLSLDEGVCAVFSPGNADIELFGNPNGGAHIMEKGREVDYFKTGYCYNLESFTASLTPASTVPVGGGGGGSGGPGR